LQQTFMVSNSSTDKQQTLLGLEGITPETKLPYFTTFLVKKKIF
jgi:precorrin-2 C20-methyltransferase, putative